MRAGNRLTDLIAAGPLSGGLLVDIGQQLAELVASTHERGGSIGHLSPNTVFVDESGDVYVLDAGWAAISARQEHDIQCLGIVLYQMATGSTPFGNGLPAPSATESNPRLPPGLVQVLARALDPDSERRFRSARQLKDQLDEVRRAPGSLESLLPAEHISSTAAVKPPPRPELDAEYLDDSSESLNGELF